MRWFLWWFLWWFMLCDGSQDGALVIQLEWEPPADCGGAPVASYEATTSWTLQGDQFLSTVLSMLIMSVQWLSLSDCLVFSDLVVLLISLPLLWFLRRSSATALSSTSLTQWPQFSHCNSMLLLYTSSDEFKQGPVNRVSSWKHVMLQKQMQ